ALQEEDPGFLPFTLMSLRQGTALEAAEVAAAFTRRAAYRAELGALLERFDVLLAPAVPTPPPLAGQDEVEVGSGTMPLRRAVLRLTTPFSLLGAPTLALPTAAPWIGAQLVGRHGDDARLLGLALTLEDSR
uniref:amidase family protein n=1 Tax=uncultured Deinococcus sp. TaxID=158789 RepID=UPI00258BD3F4